MKIINVEQRSESWFELRRKSLGASDSPIILGDNPWKTAMRLWEEKVGLVEPDRTISAAAQRGIDLEPEALARFNRDFSLAAEPLVGRHRDIDWLIASFDGIDLLANVQVEIKCPGMADHAAALNGKVPSKYKAQLQHQMLVSGATACIYMSYFPDREEHSAVYLTIQADPAYQENLLNELRAFHRCVYDLTPPKPLTAASKVAAASLVNRDADVLYRASCERYRDLDAQEKHIAEAKKACREDILQMSEGQPSWCSGIKVLRTQTRGKLDYDRMIEDYSVDVEKYRGEPVDGWRITIGE